MQRKYKVFLEAFRLSIDSLYLSLAQQYFSNLIKRENNYITLKVQCIRDWSL